MCYGLKCKLCCWGQASPLAFSGPVPVPTQTSLSLLRMDGVECGARSPAASSCAELAWVNWPSLWWVMPLKEAPLWTHTGRKIWDQPGRGRGLAGPLSKFGYFCSFWTFLTWTRVLCSVLQRPQQLCSLTLTQTKCHVLMESRCPPRLFSDCMNLKNEILD